MAMPVRALAVTVLLAAGCPGLNEEEPRSPAPLDQEAYCRYACDVHVLAIGGDPDAYVSAFCPPPKFGCGCAPITLRADPCVARDDGRAPYPPAP